MEFKKFVIKYRNSEMKDFQKKAFDFEVGKIRLHYNIKDSTEKKINRNNFILIKSENNKNGIIRKVLLGSNPIISNDEIIIDYDSLLELLNNKEIPEQNEISLNIKKISFFSGIRFLSQAPNLNDRLSFRLGLYGLLIGIISLIIALMKS